MGLIEKISDIQNVASEKLRSITSNIKWFYIPPSNHLEKTHGNLSDLQY
jgi:plasmid maintenance system killer protein